MNTQVTSGVKGQRQVASPHEPYRLIHPLGKQKVLKSSHQRSLDLKNLNMKKKLLEGMLQHQQMGAHASAYSPVGLAPNQAAFGHPRQILALRQRGHRRGGGAGPISAQDSPDAAQNQVEILVQYPTSPSINSPFSGWEAGLKPAEDSLVAETVAVAGKDIEEVLDAKEDDMAAQVQLQGTAAHTASPSVTQPPEQQESTSARFGPPSQARGRPQAKTKATSNVVEAERAELARYGVVGVATAPAAPSAKATASRLPTHRSSQRPQGLRGARDKDLNVCIGKDLQVVYRDSQPGSSAAKSPMLIDNV